MPDVHPWAIEHRSGSAAHFHAQPLPDPVRRSVWWFAIDRPALVLGSAQRDDVVDTAAVATARLEVVRRRSGGGAVLLTPGEVTWVDVIIPARDPLWHDDVGRAFDWLGEAWVATFETLGVVDPRAHRGAMVRTAWSDLVCFAGLGRGEVTVGGRKVVGISQRRTRHGARFQCAVLHVWDPAALLAVLRLTPTERQRAASEVADSATGLALPSAGANGLEAAFLRELGVDSKGARERTEQVPGT